MTDLEKLLLSAYPVSREWYSESEHSRFYHEDLPDLEDEELADEFERIRFVFLWCSERNLHPWHFERKEAVEVEVARRKAEAKHEASATAGKRVLAFARPLAKKATR